MRVDATAFLLAWTLCRAAAASAPSDPATDTDQEGAFSLTDLCPDAPETLNAYRDDDGCPDHVPKDILAALRPVPFTPHEGKRAEKGRFSRPMLAAFRRIVTVLREHPEINIEVSWHADWTETTSYSYWPSGRRAAETQKFFIVAGIPSERLYVRGAGNDEPIASNRTARGRARNRRVEFTLFR